MSVVKKQSVTKAWLNSAANANTLSPGDFYVVERDGTYQATSGSAFVKVEQTEVPPLPDFGAAAFADIITALMTGTPTAVAMARNSLTTENLNDLTYQNAPGLHFQNQTARGTLALNYPAAGSAGTLLVLGGPYAGTQFFIRYGATANTVPWLRCGLQGGIWSGWTKIVAPGESNSFSAVNSFSAATNLNGGAKLGESGPTIKQRSISGTTPAEGTDQSFSTGAQNGTIIDFAVLVTSANGNKYKPDSVQAGFTYRVMQTATGNLNIQVPSGNPNMAGRAFTALITYTA